MVCMIPCVCGVSEESLEAGERQRSGGWGAPVW